MSIKSSPVEVETQEKWNMIGRRKTAPAPEISPSSILPPLLSNFTLIPAKEKFGARFRNVSTFLTFSVV